MLDGLSAVEDGREVPLPPGVVPVTAGRNNLEPENSSKLVRSSACLTKT